MSSRGLPAVFPLNLWQGANLLCLATRRTLLTLLSPIASILTHTGPVPPHKRPGMLPTTLYLSAQHCAGSARIRDNSPHCPSLLSCTRTRWTRTDGTLLPPVALSTLSVYARAVCELRACRIRSYDIRPARYVPGGRPASMRRMLTRRSTSLC